MAAAWAIRTQIIHQNLNLADLAKQLNMETALLNSFLADVKLHGSTLASMAKLLWGDGVEYSVEEDRLYSAKTYKAGAVTTTLNGNKKRLVCQRRSESRPLRRSKSRPVRARWRPLAKRAFR